MKTKQAIQAILIMGATVLSASSQGQTLLYDNGPINGTADGEEIDSGYALANSFTLAANSTVANATVGIWNIGDSLSSVQWSITTAPFGGMTLAAGTAATTDTFLRSGGPGYSGYSIYSDSFSISPTQLAAGTYWFQLGHAVSTKGEWVFWDVNSGPSSAYENFYGSTPSESFQLYGTITSAPEPSTIALALMGGLSLVCLHRRK
jgi:hypothetical protein